MKEIKIIPCTHPTVNSRLIRLNCLMLAHLDERAYPKIGRAKQYFDWVMNDKMPGDGECLNKIQEST